MGCSGSYNAARGLLDRLVNMLKVGYASPTSQSNIPTKHTYKYAAAYRERTIPMDEENKTAQTMVHKAHTKYTMISVL